MSSHPIPGVAKSLVPDTLVKLKTFHGSDRADLEKKVNEWVEETGNLIVMPGPITDPDPKPFTAKRTMAVTYVPASGDHNDPGRKQRRADRLLNQSAIAASEAGGTKGESGEPKDSKEGKVSSSQEIGIQKAEAADHLGKDKRKPSRANAPSNADLSDGPRP